MRETNVDRGRLHRAVEAEYGSALVAANPASGRRHVCGIRDVTVLATAAPCQLEFVGAAMIMFGGARLMNGSYDDWTARAEHESNRKDGSRQ